MALRSYDAEDAIAKLQALEARFAALERKLNKFADFDAGVGQILGHDEEGQYTWYDIDDRGDLKEDASTSSAAG